MSLLWEFADLFAWASTDMPGIDPPHQLTSPTLAVNPEVRPVIQKRRPTGAECHRAVQEEVARLLAAGFIEEVCFYSWVANVVLVRKANGKWRMCVDYTDLSKACPKDAYSLPRIDQLVDAMAGHQLLSFMDAYSGYN